MVYGGAFGAGEHGDGVAAVVFVEAFGAGGGGVEGGEGVGGVGGELSWGVVSLWGDGEGRGRGGGSTMVDGWMDGWAEEGLFNTTSVWVFGVTEGLSERETEGWFLESKVDVLLKSCLEVNCSRPSEVGVTRLRDDVPPPRQFYRPKSVLSNPFRLHFMHQRRQFEKKSRLLLSS